MRIGVSRNSSWENGFISVPTNPITPQWGDAANSQTCSPQPMHLHAEARVAAFITEGPRRTLRSSKVVPRSKSAGIQESTFGCCRSL